MHWDDPLFTGTHGKWTWVVVRQLVRGLPALTLKHHEGQRLCITAFDSGPITPSDDERALGWTQMNDVMVSPPLRTSLDIPCDTHDEWYIFLDLPNSLGIDDRFVNYFGFTLVNPRELAESLDPTWDPKNYDWLIPVQLRFWANIERLNPSTYLCSGDTDVIVTQNPMFAARILDLARKIVG